MPADTRKSERASATIRIIERSAYHGVFGPCASAREGGGGGGGGRAGRAPAPPERPCGRCTWERRVRSGSGGRVGSRAPWHGGPTVALRVPRHRRAEPRGLERLGSRGAA